MAPEIRRLHATSWLFMTATSVKALLLPVIFVLFVSGSSPWARYQALSLLAIVPAFVAALLKQRIYSYRFTDEELIIRDGILTKKERHIPYHRVHNIGVVRNPVHRMLGVASARVETAAGGEAEAVMRVLTLEAVGELSRYTLGSERDVAKEEAATEATATPSGKGSARSAARAPSVLLRLPPVELIRLGLISNRGFLVVAAFFSLMSQTNWWDRDWQAYYGAARDNAPAWSARLLTPGSLVAPILLGVALVLLFVVLVRLFSVAWYLVKYYDFTLRREKADLRTEFGLLTRVSSLIPVHRIQLLTTNASLLHRAFGRAGIDLETAGAIETTSENPGSALTAELGGKSRQWIAPVIEADRAPVLIREVMPEIDLEAVEWKPLAARAARRILKKRVLLLALLTAAIMALLALTPIPVSGLHALWLPALGVPLIYLGAIGWVRQAGYALTDNAVFFRSGWLAHRTSVVRFDKLQTVSMRESPFDRRHRMASVAVDTAGAGSTGHRIDIPYLDVDVARAMRERLYAETCATEFSW